jgi:hypothetical protein
MSLLLNIRNLTVVGMLVAMAAGLSACQTAKTSEKPITPPAVRGELTPAQKTLVLAELGRAGLLSRYKMVDATGLLGPGGLICVKLQEKSRQTTDGPVVMMTYPSSANNNKTVIAGTTLGAVDPGGWKSFCRSLGLRAMGSDNKNPGAA